MPSEAIEKLIKNPDATIEDFLDEEDFLQESKSSTKWINRDRVRKLVDYIIKMPEVDEHNLAHKFPFNSNEILTNEIKEVIDMFF